MTVAKIEFPFFIFSWTKHSLPFMNCKCITLYLHFTGLTYLRSLQLWTKKPIRILGHSVECELTSVSIVIRVKLRKTKNVCFWIYHSKTYNTDANYGPFYIIRSFGSSKSDIPTTICLKSSLISLWTEKFRDTTHYHQNVFSLDIEYYDQTRNLNFCMLKGPNLLLNVKFKIFH
jgi:hypothetical protein